MCVPQTRWCSKPIYKLTCKKTCGYCPTNQCSNDRGVVYPGLAGAVGVVKRTNDQSTTVAQCIDYCRSATGANAWQYIFQWGADAWNRGKYIACSCIDTEKANHRRVPSHAKLIGGELPGRGFNFNVAYHGNAGDVGIVKRTNDQCMSLTQCIDSCRSATGANAWQYILQWKGDMYIACSCIDTEKAEHITVPPYTQLIGGELTETEASRREDEEYVEDVSRFFESL